jgi:glycine/D-amino acid oxidase-like deaminating enzyme
MGHLMVMSGPEPMYQLSRSSLTLWKQFHRDVGGFEMRESGCLWLGESDEDLPLLQTMHDAILGFGDTGEILSPAELSAREPELAPDLVGAFYYPDDAVIFPMQATGALLGAAIRQGGAIRLETNVRGLRRSADGAVRAVVTDRGEIETSVVINAAGPWAPDIAEMAGLPRLPIFPRRGDLAITMPQDLRVKTQMVEVAYLRTATGKAPDPESSEVDPGACALNLQPQGNGTVLIGSTRQFAGYDRTVNTKLLRDSFERAARFVPAVAGLQVVRTWAGLRPYTKDKVPVIGPVGAVPGLFVAGGHEGLGVTLSMATGALLAQAVKGEPLQQPLDPFVPDRFAEVVADG